MTANFLLCSLMIDTSLVDVSPAMPPNNEMSSMSDMPVSPTSVASTGHFPFSASEISGIGVETSTLDTAFTSDVASSIGLQLPPNNVAGTSRDSLRSLAQIPWNFSLSDLTADLSNLGGNYDLISVESFAFFKMCIPGSWGMSCFSLFHKKRDL